MTKIALNLPGGNSIGENDLSIFAGGTGWQFGTGTGAGGKLTLANIINSLLPIIFVIAGLVLFGMLIAGGFTIFLSAGNPEKIKKGTGTITSALVGFLIIFAAYWIIQLIEITFGLRLLR